MERREERTVGRVLDGGSMLRAGHHQLLGAYAMVTGRNRERRLLKPITLTTRLGIVLCWTWGEWGREVLAARG